ncbi:UDP-3-O-acyl-N-acetylglucosamine deacetylase [Oscillatoria sp. CS-180]|uniref:UDP-3-O-acyl-N-acetylglucosamine deacetylase n=1 Tax=Oscillatoria sp. CS-180 TaxID=3021720 RepID=UPI00232F2F48|nr:UDP-3-O-acyl-N-acetylglucosamine deacetylase [Oscillatoria sp. CS-180]MDB9528563.1 UDP-3-O-acyl-N-acetylglucosamine deacetylase [Oscillatoria sp. CS-180]
MTQTIPSGMKTAVSTSLPQQQTVEKAVAQVGIGLHSGVETQVRIQPAAAHTGRVFVRTDLPDAPVIPARIEAVRQTMLSTELAVGDATVRTVEHLLAAMAGLGIDNARIEVDGPEMPLLDGSAQVWVEALQAAGCQVQSGDRPVITVSEPIWVRDQDAFVVAMPAPAARFTYGIDFDLPAIGNQWYSWSPDTQSFVDEVAPARTFGLAHQIEYLRQQGLIKGGSLENALVCDREGWVNPPLRFENEPARHKLLDLIGDLSLLGALPTAHVVAYKASHALHTQLAKALSQATAVI